VNGQSDNLENLNQADSSQPKPLTTERAGQKVGAKVGRFAESVGNKFDSAMDRVEDSAQTVKQSFDRLSEEGLEGLKQRAIDYARQQPWNALLLALGTGILLGWATKRK
jgi:ElaB/YqjD/DUF883 family membrane-anchored ribosome-binding protein